MLKPHEDAFGEMIWDHFEGRSADGVVERDDGLVEAGCGPVQYLSEYVEWPEQERACTEFVQGRVLDLGCGAGRHALHFQDRGHDVVGIDVSPKAIRVCKRRGLKHARVLSVTQVTSALGAFDTVLMLGNNFGLVANATRARWLLRRLASITSPNARIVASSTNPYGTKHPCHLRYHARNRKRGRMPGQLRIRIRYWTYCTPWFDYLLVSPREMRGLLVGTPWRQAEVIGPNDEGRYHAILEKR
ncbi:MAG: methyltransferase domain-containing protein [Nitrospiraceae bacterium]|nr:methyltransferase domain-containing protein [Nitrospiraceae bacterium]